MPPPPPTTPASTGVPPPNPPTQSVSKTAGNGNGNGSRWRSFLQTLGRVTLGTLIISGGAFYYVTQRDRHPGIQLPHDDSKKTLLILGSGWGATSLLKVLDTSEWNVVVVSPKNFFLFTPLLPSVAVGTLAARSIIQSTRYVTRHKARKVEVIEGEALDIDPVAKKVTITDPSPIVGTSSTTDISYDYLVYAVGAETQTFGIPGVKEHACFMKELGDAQKFQDEMMDCIESAAFPQQPESEVDRLLHMVVVGGGPTGVELSGEIHDFLSEDLKYWYPEFAPRMKITLIEALPNVLPMFSKQLIEYTESTFRSSKIAIRTGTMVKEITPQSVVVETKEKGREVIPCGLVVWAGGNTLRPLTKKLMSYYTATQTNRRGLTIDDRMRLVVPSETGENDGKTGSDSIFAIGDCTSTAYAPTAQVASQQGAYLGRMLNQVAKREAVASKLAGLESLSENAPEGQEGEQVKLRKQLDRLSVSQWSPFHYSHQGSLAYIGSDKAIADLPFPLVHGNIASAGVATYLFWRSAYLSTLFSLRNRVLVGSDWLKTKIFGRDVSRE